MKYQKERKKNVTVVVNIFFEFDYSDWETMNNLALEKKAKTFGLKKILLTLKKGPRHCDMTAVIAPIGKNLDVKITDRKLIKIDSKDGNMFLKEMPKLKKFDTSDKLRPKITQVLIPKRKSFLNMKKCSILNNVPLTSESELREKFGNILNDSKIADNSKNKALAEPSTLNKQDRFVPNILRSTKTVENTLNGDSLVKSDLTRTSSSQGTDDKHCKDDTSVKRKRKQVLSSLNIKHDWTRRARVMSKTNEFKKSLLRFCNNNSNEESQTKALEITVANSEQEGNNTCPEVPPESSTTLEKLPTESCDSKDSYPADIDIPYETQNLPSIQDADINCNYDKSIEKIFEEFEVADYQNYIDREDLGFDIDEMDKLLSSDIDSSLTDSSIDHSTAKIVEYDVNGNDIDNYGHALKRPTDDKKRKLSDIRCKIQSSYDDETEQEINTSRKLGYDINLDEICSGPWDDFRSYKTCEMNLWSNEFADCYSTDNFQNFNRTFDRDLSSTDTASESDTNDFNSSQTSSLILPENEKLDRSATSLVISDMVPDKVFSEESCLDESVSDDDTAKWLSASNSIMQQYHMNYSNSNDDNYRTSLSGMPFQRYTSDSQLYDGFNGSLEIFEDGNFLVDNMLNINYALSKEDETCETILANSNAKFGDKYLSRIHRILANLDIENADDIEISRLLRSGDTRMKDFTPVSDAALLPHLIEPIDDQPSMDTANQSNADDIFMSNCDDAQLGTINVKNLPQVQAESALKESTNSESAKLSPSIESETELQGRNADDADLKCSDSILENILSKNQELLLPCDRDKKKVDGTTSSSLSPPVLPIEGNSVTKLKASKLESLLTGSQTCVNHPSSYYCSAMSCSLLSDSRVFTTEPFSQVAGHSDVDIFDSTISSDKSFSSQVSGFEDITDISCSSAAQEGNEATEEIVITIDDDYSVAERRNYHSLKSASSLNLDSYKYQSITSSVYPKKLTASGQVFIDLTKSKKGIWQDLVKRSKYVMKNINNISCDFCDNKYGSEVALADHIERIHRYRPSRFRCIKKKYVCDKCSKEYMFAAAIEKHFKLHDDYILTCRICEKHFSEKIYLRRHVHSSHLDWKIQCSYCGRKFSRLNTLSRHIKTCHGLEDF